MRFTDMRQDRLAFDREPSARTYDGDGHLHVKQCHISKAMVCPYLGREIPEADKLGLDADRVYYLLRDPGELERGAQTFNGKPLLFDHRPVTADDHDHDLTVGAISNVNWNPPYLDADISCWSGPAIDQIVDESRKQLSCGYRYTADMTPGTFQGVKYDGVMRDIVGNHVSLVKSGRAGPDVVVGDTAIEEIHMPNTALTRAGAHAQGAVSSFIYAQPIAQDAKIDLRPLSSVFADITAKNFRGYKPMLALGIKGALAGKLAADENLDDVDAMLDRVEQAVEDLSDTVDGAKAGGEEEASAEDDDDLRAKLEAAGVPEDVIAKVMAEMAKPADDVPAADEKDEKKDDKPAMDSRIPAMDAELRRLRADLKAAEDRAAARLADQRGMYDALNVVRPHVGDFALDGINDANGVYRTALVIKGEDLSGVDPSAYPAMFRMAVRQAEPKRAAPIAQDAASLAEFKAAFPHADRFLA